MKINEDGSYASGPAKKPKPSLKLPGKSLVLVLVVVLLAILVMDSFYTLKEDQYAVITTFGKPTTVSTSGLKFKLPFVQQVTKVSKTIQGFPLGYRMNSSQSVDDESLMITYDYNFVNVDFYVEYRVTDPIKYLYSSQEPVDILKMLCQSYIRDTIGLYNVDAVITTGKSEILEAGMNATSITVGTMSNSYSVNSIASIEGLEAFPALATLNVGSCMVDKVDVSKYPALTSVTLLSLNYLTEVNLGDKEIEKLSCKTTGYGYHRVESVTFKGSKVKEIDFSGSSSYIGYGYETALKTVDVTACPALEKLNTKRVSSSSYYSSQTSLETIYVTSAQAESVQVTKNDHTQVVVK